MKISFNTITALAATLILSVSCGKALEDNRTFLQENNRQITFTASQETNTKTSVDDNTGKVYWSPNEKIKVFFDSTPAEFTSLNTDKALIASFSGMLPIIIGSSEGYPASTNIMGLYPYDVDATCTEGTISTKLKHVQTATENSFAEGAFPTISRTTATNYNLVFYNICGGVKFSVKTQGIKKVILKGNNNEKLAGDIKVRFNDNGIPEVTDITDESYRIVLTSSTGLATDKSYYLVSLPIVFTNGLTIRLETDTEYAERVINDEKEIRRSVWGVLANIDEGLTWNTKPDFENPLTFTSHGETEIQLCKTGNPDEIKLQYKKNDGTYQDYELSDFISLNDGETISFQAKTENKSFSKDFSNYYRFLISGEGTMSVSGNIMSLLSHSEQPESIPENCFSQLFYGCDILTDAHELQLPATTLAKKCYEYMFGRCTSLTKAPALPATTLAEDCYNSLFDGCTLLTEAPAELPALKLATNCYHYMFNECTSLTDIPVLPATTLAEKCYSCMFRGCTSLTKAPTELPATTLAAECYDAMFLFCSKLETAPNLPATTLAEKCYNSMFSGCESLTKAPTELPATTLAKECYEYMFEQCSKLETAPNLPATTLAEECYRNMFTECSKLEQVSTLPATTLALRCYYGMFENCISLTSAPELPSTTLAEECYSLMFKGCSKLEQAPVLSAPKLKNSCYREMFSGCTSLSYVKCLAKEEDDADGQIGYFSCSGWLENVCEKGTFVKATGIEWRPGESGIPYDWEVKEE